MTDKFFFGTYYRARCGKQYVWVCVKCGYVYETDDGGVKNILKFLKGHICRPKEELIK